MLDLEFGGGLRALYKGFGGGALDLLGVALEGDDIFAIPGAEAFLLDVVELPESDTALKRRELTGIRECEFRRESSGEVDEEGIKMSLRCMFELANCGGTAVFALNVRRCEL